MLRLRTAMLVSPLVIGAMLSAAPAAQASTPDHVTMAVAPPGGFAAPRTQPAIPAHVDVLEGASCTSASSCMSVGWFRSGSVYPALSELLSGTSWVVKPVPRPATKNFATVAIEVSCATASNCMLVGDHYRDSRSPVLIAETWNGSRWSIVASINPVGAKSSWLGDVACIGQTFCMTVGQETLTSGRMRAMARQWNGARWGPITIPAPAHARTSALAGLACVTITYCMAVGDYQKAGQPYFTYAARWNGTSWHILTTPNARGETSSTFNAVACPTQARCTAVGYSFGPGQQQLIETFSQGTWHLTATPRRASKNALLGVSCADASHCVAVGWSGQKSLIEAWNGQGWTAQTTPATGTATPGNSLLHVSCVAVTNCEAVGYRFNPNISYSYRTLAEIWNGHIWKLQTTPNP